MLLAHCLYEGNSGHAAGRDLLARLYRQQTGENLPAIASTPRGKPYFVDSPWYFSISHTKGHAFCALSHNPIGLDAEILDRPVNLGLAEKILSPMEKQQFDVADDPHKTLLTFWVLKEAAAKLSGEGLKGYPNHTEFILPHKAVQEIHGCLVAILEEENHVI